MRNGLPFTLMIALGSLAVAGCIPRGDPPPRQPAAPPQTGRDSKAAEVGKETGKIVTQPARDVGASKITIPAVLIHARGDPYTLAGTENCASIDAEMAQLDEALGPDFEAGDPDKKENKAGRLARAGGQTVVNAIIPFRALVREISGAAPAQRRLNDAVDAGFARRGYLRAIRQAQACPVAQ